MQTDLNTRIKELEAWLLSAPADAPMRAEVETDYRNLINQLNENNDEKKV